MSNGSDVFHQQRELRTVARDIFLHALSECGIDRAFDRHVGYERHVLRVCEDLYDLSAFSRVLVVSIGKAAHTSAESLVTRLGAGSGVTGIVCGPTDPAAQLHGFRYFRGGHPLPNGESVKAATDILRSLANLDEDSLVIYLLSGGGSALVERPIDDDISIDDLIATYRVLVHRGAPIAEINAIRKHLSAIKGGRMAAAAAPAQQVSLLISDVPDNALDSLASGPTMPDSSTVEMCWEIAHRYKLLPEFPASVRALFERHALEETPKHDDPIFACSRWWTLLSNEFLRRAAKEKAAALGFSVIVDNSCDDWDYREAADYLLRRVREVRGRSTARVCLVSGGEVTVKVEGDPGMGGRNQQFALDCAHKIAGENITVLSAGSDGVDGNSPSAGAVADGSTIERARSMGLDSQISMQHFDAYPLFHALGDDMTIGPTGNNVRDLRLLLAF